MLCFPPFDGGMWLDLGEKIDMFEEKSSKGRSINKFFYWYKKNKLGKYQ